MKSLINIQINESGIQSVNARELHYFLESKQAFANWIRNRIEQYGFIEEVDFTINKSIIRKATQIDYIISINMAKEISMVEKNEKGKQARRYFIECEQQLMNNRSPQLTYEEQVVNVLQLTQAKIAKLEVDVLEMTPKAALHDLKHTCGTAIKIKDFTDNLDIGVQKFYNLMRDWNWVCKKTSNCPTSPTRYAIDQGYLKAKSYTSTRTGGSPFEMVSSRITVKGQERALKKLEALRGDAA